MGIDTHTRGSVPAGSSSDPTLAMEPHDRSHQTQAFVQPVDQRPSVLVSATARPAPSAEAAAALLADRAPLPAAQERDRRGARGRGRSRVERMPASAGVRADGCAQPPGARRCLRTPHRRSHKLSSARRSPGQLGRRARRDPAARASRAPVARGSSCSGARGSPGSPPADRPGQRSVRQGRRSRPRQRNQGDPRSALSPLRVAR